MKILQNLMNLNFAELIKYDFESIDIEVTAKNGKILKDTIKYDDLLPTTEEIEKYVKKSNFFRDDLYQSWNGYKDTVPKEEKTYGWDDDTMTEEEKIELWDDNMMDEEFNAGNFEVLTNEVLKSFIKRNELENVYRKILKKEEFNDLYYDNYITRLNIYETEENCFCFKNCESYGYYNYDDLKNTMKKIIDIIKELLEQILSSNEEVNFDNKKNITKLIKVVIDDMHKKVDILDMTKVYNFGNDLVTSSLIKNNLLEWKSDLPPCNNKFATLVKWNVYEIVLDNLKELEDIDIEDSENYKIESKDISELNSIDTIEINSIINHYFYKKDFTLDINKKTLEYYIKYRDVYDYVNSEESEIENSAQVKDKFIKYIRPIIIKNGPFDANWTSFKAMYQKMFCDFCTKEWQLFEENINPKIKVLQELLNKYMMNKDVEVTPMGLLVKSKGDNRNIPLNSLSSGEKKLLVIFMHCLFNEDVPIIIDEPEISLSIIWQEDLLPDLLEKTNIKQIIVATHSSAVISNSILDNYIIPLPNSKVIKEEYNTNE